MKAFVTGATGFIGRRLVKRLQDEKVEVTALVRNEEQSLTGQVTIVTGDVLSPENLKDAGKGCDRMYHLAGLITFDPSRRRDLLLVNGKGTENMLQAARNWGIPRSVVGSSACTLGLSYSPDQVLDEDARPAEILAAKNPYMASKLEAEKQARQASEDQEVVIVNPTTVYGPGDWTMNSGSLIAHIVRSSVIPVPPGGSNVVDVDDVVQGIMAAGERGVSGQRYILGGENSSFADIFRTVAGAVKRRPLFVPLPASLRGPAALTAAIVGGTTGSRFLTSQIVSDMFCYKYYSSDLAERDLGWRARHCFAESVRRAWRFYCRHGLIA